MALKVKTLKIITILLFFSVLTFKVFSESNQFVPFQTFSADFQRETIENGELLFTTGKIFFYKPYNVFIDVSEPLNQKMLIDSNLMLIYYPDENKGLKISSQEPLALPILSPFFSSTKSDFGLSIIGYSIKDYSMNSDTLSTKWSIPDQIDDNSYFFEIKTVNNRIIEVLVSKAKKNLLIKRMIFSTYVELSKELWIPQELVIYDNENAGQIVESIALKNIMLDIELPDSILKFIIPENAETEEIQW
ncbi:MAG: hypothetical protein V1779_16680 [bacterium]